MNFFRASAASLAIFLAGAGTVTPAFGVRHPKQWAQTLLKEATVPPSSVRMSVVPVHLRKPGQTIACAPKVDIHEIWSTPSSIEQVLAYVTTHVPPNMMLSATGRNRPFWMASEYRKENHRVSEALQVVYTIAPYKHSTALRIDAIVVPRGGKCI